MSKCLDASAVLRWLLDDIPEQADIVEKAITEGAHTVPEVMAEVVYVLQGVYRLNRTETADALLSLLEEINIHEKPVIKEALRVYAETGLDYVDCVLTARAKVLQESVLTFDRKLNNRLKSL